MKIVALLCGLLVSAFAWGAGAFATDVGVQFLDLWPETISQQFLGLASWHAIVAAALVGGILAVFSPISGALLLLAAGAGWAWLAYTLPIGFDAQMIVPIALCGAGALAALGASFRGLTRRHAEERESNEPSAEDLEREEALRLEPSDDIIPPFELPPETERTLAGIAPSPERQRQLDEAPPQGLSGAMAFNVAALLLLAGAVGLLAYSEIRSGDLMAAFAPSGPRAARVAEGAPSKLAAVPDAASDSDLTPVNIDTPETAAPDDLTPVAPADAEPVVDTAVAPAEEAAPPADLPAEQAGLQPVAATEGPWQDPFSYCTAVGTVDFPDRRYAGPPVVTGIAAALRVPESSSPDRVKWRCYEGAVMACAAFDRPVCALTPTVAEMVEFCAQNPDTPSLLAPNGNWSCDGTQPIIPEDQNWPVDARGFLPSAWQVVADPSSGSG